MPARTTLAVAVLAAVAACAPEATPVTKHGYSGKPPLGAPITAAELALEPFTDAAVPGQAWSWISFPDTACADGSSAGIAVSPGNGADLLVFLDGGGACWDYLTCETAGTAVDDRYGTAQFAVELHDYFAGSLVDRTIVPPALDDPTLVFVPYCTGDIHGGDHAATYTSPFLEAARWSHTGHANLMAFLERVAATWPAPRKLVVAGSSAGGFGTLVSYAALRWYYPDARGYLVDDSGPPLVGGDIGTNLRRAWYDAWNLGVSLDPFCLECRDDLSASLVNLSGDHLGDRIAVLSHQDDLVMATFLQNPTFGTALGRLAVKLEATPNARVFYEAGTDHMLLAPLVAGQPSVAAQTSQGVMLADWLQQMVSDAPEWTSVRP